VQRYEGDKGLNRS